MRFVMFSFVACTAIPYIYFFTLIYKRRDFGGKKVIESNICALI